jgi:phosphoenolpyruvate carboxylase
LQLAKTKFSKKEKPTPYEEARALNWYLINVFYQVIPDLKFKLAPALEDPFTVMKNNPLFEVGFWPGGDRDGNPFVTHKTTLDVARLLKRSILNCYHDDVRKLKRLLTFEGILEKLETIQGRVFNSFEACLKDEFHPDGYNQPEDFLKDLMAIRQDLIDRHQSLFLSHMDRLIYKVISFGFHFASLDMRQDSRIHAEALLHFCTQDEAITKALPSRLLDQIKDWDSLADQEKYECLCEILKLELKPSAAQLKHPDQMSSEVLRSAQAISKVQRYNGEKGLNRYIISNTQRSADVLTVLAFAQWMDLGDKSNDGHIHLDIVPLFETIDDLKNARSIMTELYSCPTYLEHLKSRKKKQHIMLGFSDGTKDGGPIAANWSIHQAKVALSELSSKHGVTVHFFDGRGGPPARGGGKTHQYYRAQGNEIQQKQIQLTIQGQTISTKFGSIESARYNLEELFTASLETRLFPGHLSKEELQTKKFRERTLMDELSEISLEAYRKFKSHELFVPYLEEITPLKYISYLNIASRPTRRKSEGPMKFEDLRAIPFVSSWSQMKQNIPGYYGIGFALEKFIKDGRTDDIVWMYENSLFFKTLMENAMMSLAKSNMKLTQYLSEDKKFGKFWHLIDEEVELCRKYLKQICGQKKLMDNYPANRASIDLREQVVLPLLVIQQYALIRLREDEGKLSAEHQDALVKIVLKALAANINASRNSA